MPNSYGRLGIALATSFVLMFLLTMSMVTPRGRPLMSRAAVVANERSDSVHSSSPARETVRNRPPTSRSAAVPAATLISATNE